MNNFSSLKALTLSLSLIAVSSSALAQESWENPGSDGSEKGTQIVIEDPNAFNLSKSQGYYVFTEKDLEAGYTLNGRPVIPGKDKIFVGDGFDDGLSYEKGVYEHPWPKKCNIEGGYCSSSPYNSGKWCQTLGSECNSPSATFCDPVSRKCVKGGRGHACNSDEPCQDETNTRCDTYFPGTCVVGGAGGKCDANDSCPTKVCEVPLPGSVHQPKCADVGLPPGYFPLSNVPCSADSECKNLKVCNQEGKCGLPGPVGSMGGLCADDGDCKQKFCQLFDHEVPLHWGPTKCVSGLPSSAAQKECKSDEECRVKGCIGPNNCRWGSSGANCANCPEPAPTGTPAPDIQNPN